MSTTSDKCVDWSEQIRDSGGHALIVVDSLKPMVDLWTLMNKVIKDTDRVGLSDEIDAENPSAAAEADSDFDLVEYEGMIVTAIAAQRRRWDNEKACNQGFGQLLLSSCIRFSDGDILGVG